MAPPALGNVIRSQGLVSLLRRMESRAWGSWHPWVLSTEKMCSDVLSPRKDGERGVEVIPGTKSPERRLGREMGASGAEEGWKPQTQRTRGCGGLELRGLKEGVTHNLL